jgi:hypothetical protein
MHIRRSGRAARWPPASLAGRVKLHTEVRCKPPERHTLDTAF